MRRPRARRDRRPRWSRQGAVAAGTSGRSTSKSRDAGSWSAPTPGPRDRELRLSLWNDLRERRGGRDASDPRCCIEARPRGRLVPRGLAQLARSDRAVTEDRTIAVGRLREREIRTRRFSARGAWHSRPRLRGRVLRPQRREMPAPPGPRSSGLRCAGDDDRDEQGVRGPQRGARVVDGEQRPVRGVVERVADAAV